MARDVADRLHAHEWPVSVAYEGELLTRTRIGSMHLNVRRDDESGDGITYAEGTGRNPRKVASRSLGVVVDVFVRAEVDGARVNEHQHLCDDLVDAVIANVDEWGVASRAGHITFTESRYLTREERDELVAQDRGHDCAGVVYRVRFRVPHGVRIKNYDMSARPTAAAASVITGCKVSIDGTNYQEVNDGNTP